MLTEEALILLGTIGAFGLLVLGVVELVWPARPRHAAPRRPPLAETPTAVARRLGAARELATTAVSVDVPPSPETAEDRAALPVLDAPVVATEPAAAVASDVPLMVAPPIHTAAEPVVEAPPPEIPAPALPSAPVRSTGEARTHVLPIETCRTMYDEGRFAEVISLGSAALEVHAGLAGMSHRPDEAAAILDLVGLSKQQLGDRMGACTAFRAAVRAEHGSARAVYAGHALAAVGDVAADTAGGSSMARIRELRACLAALDDVAPFASEEDVDTTGASLRQALAGACDALAEDAGDEARAVILEVLRDPAMPAPWREKLGDRLIAGSSAAIGQLTAQAIRCVQDGKDEEAFDTLARAERLAEALPSGGVADERREEFERRLWWGYSKVGLRCIETQAFDRALEPLFRALRFGRDDEERAAEIRGALVRALEGVVETAAPDILRRGAADPYGARGRIDRLEEVLRGAGERGVRPDELSGLLATVAELRERVPPA